MYKLTETVEHNLSHWTVDELQLRADALDHVERPLSLAEATSESRYRTMERTYCGCGEDSKCSVDSWSAIMDELATR